MQPCVRSVFKYFINKRYAGVYTGPISLKYTEVILIVLFVLLSSFSISPPTFNHFEKLCLFFLPSLLLLYTRNGD